MPLFKVWNRTGIKKAVVVSDMESLLEQGCCKLGMPKENIKAYLEDGTEVDDNAILENLPPASVIYLLQSEEEGPWQATDFISASTPSSPLTVLRESNSSKQNVAASFSSCRSTWPKDFDIPSEKFSSDLQMALENGHFHWSEKSELLRHLAEKISTYTDNPNAHERKQVAVELISRYPSLKSDLGEGWYAWANRIYDKMKEFRRKKRQGTVLSTSRQHIHAAIESETSTEGETKCKVKKIRCRGEVNWAPSPPHGEDLISLQAHKEWLLKEFKKDTSLRSKKLIKEKMELCLSSRRVLINSNVKIATVKEEYPFLLTCGGIVQEFHWLMGIDIDKTFLSELNSIASVMLKIAEGKKKAPSEMHSIIREFNELSDKNNINNNLVVCLLLLPFMFAEKSEILYNIYPPETPVEAIKCGPNTPHVAVIGSPFTSSLVFVVAEKEIVIDCVEFVESVISTVALYYCCNVQYPDSGYCTYSFIEMQLLKLNHCHSIPRKVIAMHEKLAKYSKK